MRTSKIARENVRNFLEEKARKRVVSAVFTKLDGSDRTMTLRIGVKKNLRGGTNNVMALDRSYLTVYDMNKASYRTLNMRTVKSITSDGVKYIVE